MNIIDTQMLCHSAGLARSSQGTVSLPEACPRRTHTAFAVAYALSKAGDTAGAVCYSVEQRMLHVLCFVLPHLNPLHPRLETARRRFPLRAASRALVLH